MILADLERETIHHSRLLDEALGFYKGCISDWAEKENTYRLARARAVLSASGTVEEKRAHADLATADERHAAHLADGMKDAARQAVHARKQQLSAWQSLLSAHRAETELARTTPDFQGGHQ